MYDTASCSSMMYLQRISRSLIIITGMLSPGMLSPSISFGLWIIIARDVPSKIGLRIHKCFGFFMHDGFGISRRHDPNPDDPCRS